MSLSFASAFEKTRVINEKPKSIIEKSIECREHRSRSHPREWEQ